MSSVRGLANDRWHALTPYLDQALELTGEQRAAWLDSLRQEDAALASDLEALLREHRDAKDEGFLAGAPCVTPPPTSMAGQRAGAYTLTALIGQGGMGTVWLANRNDGRFRGIAAVKLLNAALAGPEGAARFRREGSILGRLRHPHIAQLIDAGVGSFGQPYLVLEHVDGERIDHYCDSRRLTVEARVRLFLDVLAAVAHAHANLIVHRDLKPSNVLVTAEGQVKLLDFGIAKLLEPSDGNESTPLTCEGDVMLTPEYAAPEQVTGGHVTTATDVYSLGVLLYLLLSGQHPTAPGARSPAEMIRAVVDTEARRASDAVVATNRLTAFSLAANAAQRGATPRRLRALLQGDLDTIVFKALQKRPDERYASVAAMAGDLRRFLESRPIEARPDTLAYRAAKFVRRNRLAVELVGLAALALLAGMVGTVTQARRATAQAALAEMQRVRADQAARAAGEQRDFALRQLARAETINDLNTFLLRDAAPLGKPFTAGELLARARRIAARHPDAGSRVGMMVQIGRQYLLQEQDQKARELLAEAHELAAGSSDPATRAEAGCALGGAIAVAGQAARAERMVQEALAQLPDQPQYVVHRVTCLLTGNEVALELNDVKTAMQRVEAAQALLKSSAFAPVALEHRVLVRLADTLRLSSRFREADAAYRQAFRQLESLGRNETETAGELLVQWGLTLRGLGRPLEAERIFRQVVQISSAGAVEGQLPPTLACNLARVLRELDRLAEAGRYGERCYETSRKLGQELGINQALFLLAAVRREQGDLRRAAETQAELAARLQRMLTPGDLQFATLGLERSLLAAARGDLPTAVREVDQAVAMAERGQQPQYLRRLLRGRSEVNLMAGHIEQAAADARRAVHLELEAAEPGGRSSTMGLAYLALGRALHARGSREEALGAFLSAARHLRPTLGERHAATRAAAEGVASLTPRARS
jgi:eukaryotic-like serine/threonine-protein kinase